VFWVRSRNTSKKLERIDRIRGEKGHGPSELIEAQEGRVGPYESEELGGVLGSLISHPGYRCARFGVGEGRVVVKPCHSLACPGEG